MNTGTRAGRTAATALMSVMVYLSWRALRLLVGAGREQAVGHAALYRASGAKDVRHGLEGGDVGGLQAGDVDIAPQPGVGRRVLGVEIAGLAQHLRRLVGLLAAEARQIGRA